MNAVTFLQGFGGVERYGLLVGTNREESCVDHSQVHHDNKYRKDQTRYRPPRWILRYSRISGWFVHTAIVPGLSIHMAL